MRHSLKRVLPYAPADLFTLVSDVRHYPDFVPWITHMRVFNERVIGTDRQSLDAEAGVGFALLKERFTTRVTLDAQQMIVETALLSGPFKHLKNRWRFHPHPKGTELSFEIDFAFRVSMLDLVLAANFDKAVAKLIACFESRAAALYPKITGP